MADGINCQFISNTNKIDHDQKRIAKKLAKPMPQHCNSGRVKKSGFQLRQSFKDKGHSTAATTV